MGWTLTDDLERYLAEAGGLLRADPVENTVPLGVVGALQAGAAGQGHLFGWWSTGGDVRGALLLTPGFPLMLSTMPDDAAAELADALAERDVAVTGVSGHPTVSRAFADAWDKRTGTASEVRMRQRLFRLDRLEWPDPAPEGRARLATAADQDLVHDWFTAFNDEADGVGPVGAAGIADRIAYGGVLLWEAADQVVTLAARTRMVSGMARIGPVYTPPAHRRRGYGAGVTAALSRQVLDAGAEHVVLFTDLANATSNAIYQRLGYRPVSDRLMLHFGAPV